MQTYNRQVFAEMSPFLRLFSELAQLHACLDARDFRRYLGCVLSTGADIARQRTLVPADLATLGAVSVTVRRKRIVVPLDDIRKVLADYDQPPTFGAVRECMQVTLVCGLFHRISDRASSSTSAPTGACF
jgi:hypothetical protein